MLWGGFRELASQGTLDVLPDILVVHLGGNELTPRSSKLLTIQIINDLRDFGAVFANAQIVWWNIIPRKVWRAECNSRCIDHARHGVNREVSRTVQAGLGSGVKHLDIQVSQQPELYKDITHHLKHK